MQKYFRCDALKQTHNLSARNYIHFTSHSTYGKLKGILILPISRVRWFLYYHHEVNHRKYAKNLSRHMATYIRLRMSM